MVKIYRYKFHFAGDGLFLIMIEFYVKKFIKRGEPVPLLILTRGSLGTGGCRGPYQSTGHWLCRRF